MSNFSLFDCLKIDKRFGFYTRDEGTLDSYFTGFHIWMPFSLLVILASRLVVVLEKFNKAENFFCKETNKEGLL